MNLGFDTRMKIFLIITERYERERESTCLVEGPSDRWADNHANAKKGLEDGKHGGHVFWELFGDHAEGASEKSAISTGLDYPENHNTLEKKQHGPSD